MARELSDLGQIAKEGPFAEALFGECSAAG
jgi:hypothetical protein